jgi:thymidine kinase
MAASFYPQGGWVEVIAGGMFSGKTEELIRRLRRASFARQKIQVFKPRLDDRYHVTSIASHNQNLFPSVTVETAADLQALVAPTTQVVGIDEAQFFDPPLVNVVTDLADRGLRVIVAGLDTDWRGLPFEPMPELMAIAEIISKQHAVCVVCGQSATRTQKVFDSVDRVQVGGAKIYEARCRNHFRAEVDHPTTFGSKTLSASPTPPRGEEVRAQSPTSR